MAMNQIDIATLERELEGLEIQRENFVDQIAKFEALLEAIDKDIERKYAQLQILKEPLL